MSCQFQEVFHAQVAPKAYAHHDGGLARKKHFNIFAAVDAFKRAAGTVQHVRRSRGGQIQFRCQRPRRGRFNFDIRRTLHGAAHRFRHGRQRRNGAAAGRRRRGGGSQGRPHRVHSFGGIRADNFRARHGARPSRAGAHGHKGTVSRRRAQIRVHILYGRGGQRDI